MVEQYLRQSPLAHLGLDGRARDGRGEAGVAMAEVPFRGIVNLRCDAGEEGVQEAVEAAFGLRLPVAPNTTAGGEDATAIWLGPDEWWLVVRGPDPQTGPKAAETLRSALAGRHASVVDVSESRTCLRVSGPKARALLQKGAPLDLHPRAFGAGQCAQSLLGKATVAYHLVADESAPEGPAFEVYVLRSFAEYVWLWLEDAAREYGLAVVHA